MNIFFIKIRRTPRATRLTHSFPTRRSSDLLRELVDLTPRGIRDHLGLDRAIYARTASYGHFGRTAQDDGGFSWERTDIAGELARRFGADRKSTRLNSSH